MEFELPSDLYINLITKDNIKLVTVSQSSYGWYISILIDIPDNTFYTTKTNKSVGIDWGVDKFATDSDGDRVYKCNKCGNEIDRDINAAINLKLYGMRFIG